MKFDIKKVGICFLFCLIFIVMSSVSVQAETIDLWVANGSLATSGELVGLERNSSFNDKSLVIEGSDYSTSTLARNITNYYLNWFREIEEQGWSSFELPKFEIKYFEREITVEKKPAPDNSKYFEFHNAIESSQVFLLINDVDTLEDILENPKAAGYYINNLVDTSSRESNCEVVVEMTLGEDKYRFHILPLTSYLLYYNDTTIGTTQKSSTTNNNAKHQHISAKNAIKLFEYLEKCALEGIVAGSIESGYNIGIPYSTTQRPLSDVMEVEGYGYEFINGTKISFTFGYFYSPLFGNMYLNQSPYLPTDLRASQQDPSYLKEDLWLDMIYDKRSELFKSGKIVIPETFIDFVFNLSDEYVNEQGYKLTDATIDNGATRYKFEGTKNPKNVMSYNIPLAVPYMFNVAGDMANLSTSNLKIIDGYTYCLYNDCIYNNSDMTRVASMEFEVGVPRKNIYLFHQILPGNEVGSTVQTGVALVGVFDECVVDYNITGLSTYDDYMANVYLTGRKVAFDNGYSDALNIREKNVNLLYTTSEAGKKAYLPLNVLFPIKVEESYLTIIQGLLSADIAINYPELTTDIRDALQYDTGVAFFEDLWDKGGDDNVSTHGEIPKTIRVVKLYIDFGKVVNQSKTIETVDADGNPIKKEQQGASKYAFYCVRNNAYLNDGDLIDWLKTDTAKSLTYVDAQTLLEKIEGQFRPNKLTYEDWKKMQEVKDYLQNEKDMWIVRAMNVMSLLMGVALIVFAILFMMAYWIDIFNTFTRFSILQTISFGNLYPVAEKDTIEMLPDTGTKVKYVTFKDVLILGLIMIAVGLIFMNVSSLVAFIINIYDYIMFVLGGIA